MIIYITDNPNINKKLQGDSFLLYQIFDWRIFINNEDEHAKEESSFIIKKRFKLGLVRNSIKSSDKIVAIISPSNYKLIYDLLYIKKKYSKEVIFYSWNSFKSRKRLKIIKNDIDMRFNEYVQRGYLTKLMFEQLSNFNFIRIEQFMTIVAIESSLKVIKKNKLSNVSIQDKVKINTIDFIKILLLSGFNIRKAIDKLIYHNRKLDITDPFLGFFYFNNSDNNIYKFIHMSFENVESNLDSIYSILISIIPSTDILKTIRFMAKNDFINTKNALLESKYDLSNYEIKLYIKYISSKIWEEVYRSNTFIYSGSFPMIEFSTNEYLCPICGSTELKSTPLNFFCSDMLCPLYVNRIINPGGIKKKVTENEFIRMVNNGSAFIRNKIGGYNKFTLNKVGDKYKIFIDIEKPIKEE